MGLGVGLGMKLGASLAQSVQSRSQLHSQLPTHMYANWKSHIPSFQGLLTLQADPGLPKPSKAISFLGQRPTTTTISFIQHKKPVSQQNSDLLEENAQLKRRVQQLEEDRRGQADIYERVRSKVNGW